MSILLVPVQDKAETQVDSVHDYLLRRPGTQGLNFTNDLEFQDRNYSEKLAAPIMRLTSSTRRLKAFHLGLPTPRIVACSLIASPCVVSFKKGFETDE